MGNLDFDATNRPTMDDRDGLPKGDYALFVAESAIDKTKDNVNGVPGCENDRYLKLTVQVADGPYEKRKFPIRLNLWNKNQTAVDIANKELTSLCHAIGKMKVQDSSELHFKKFMGSVDVEVNGNYTSNVIKKYYKVGEEPRTEDGKVKAPW